MSKKNFKNGTPGINDREAVQNAEGYVEHTSQLPEDRLQNTKQVLSSAELGVNRSMQKSGNDYAAKAITAASTIKSGSKVKPEASVEVLDGKQVGGVPLGGGLRTTPYSGASTISPADDISRNPSTDGGIRSSSRYGKKISDLNFEINNTISEQIAPKFDESKDLREAPDSVQGYNGRKQFTQSRGKKNAGSSPHDLLYDRSFDIITHDETVYTSGQVLDSIPSHADYPTVSYDASGSQNVSSVMHKGNYSLDGFSIHITNGGLIDKIQFSEAKFATKTGRLERDGSNMNWQVDNNNVTAAVIRMQTELGRETTEKWSPLGYVIDQPYQYNMLYHDIENTTGAVMSTAYRSAVSAMSYQQNLLSKDGADTNAPGFGTFIQGIGVTTDSDQYDGASVQVALNHTNSLRSGSAAAWIKMFDSLGKYKTKADILTQPRSLKLALSQCDNNINPLHVKKEFIKALNEAHTFSTADGSYNPLLPVYATRQVTLVNPLSLNYFLEGWVNPRANGFDSSTNDQVTGTATRYKYGYADIRNNYVMAVKHPMIEGLCKWILNHESSIVDAYGTNTWVHMPASFNMLYPTMFSLMLCAASQDIAYYRNIYFRDILFAGEQMTYIWDDLSSLKDVNPLFSTQLSIQAYDKPLKVGALSSVSKIRTFWPETLSIKHGATGTNDADVMMPWYMNEEGFNQTVDSVGSFLREESPYVMTMPSIRDETRNEYVDVIYSMTERDLRLAMDKMVTIPQPVSKTSYNGLSAASYVPLLGAYEPDTTQNRYITINTVRYDANSDGRILVNYDDDPLTYASLMCVPRELGFLTPGLSASQVVIDAIDITSKSGDKYTGNITFANDDDSSSLPGPDTTANLWRACYDFVADGSTPWTITSYIAKGNSFGSTSINANTISVTAALQQKYIRCFAGRTGDLVTYNNAFLAAIGSIPTISALMSAGSLTTLNSTVTKFTNVFDIRTNTAATSHVTTSNAVYTISIVPIIWAILNRVFFAVNPFENCLITSASSDPDSGAYVDPMENAYLFGVNGTLASDYNQDILERLNTFTQLGLNYLEDNFVKDSLIFRA